MRVELQFEGEVVITGKLAEADLRSLLSLFKDAEVEETWHSAPITVTQAQQLIALLDAPSVELLRQITLGGGSITWPQVQKICDIKGTDFDRYHSYYEERIEQAVRTVTQGKHAFLITYEDGAPEWCTDDWKDAKLEIDGPALISLQEVFTA
ncbi:hypothetical protein [Microvirga aerophila]|uniref:Uncharacterized protein n=1 Tax=Microvirga aerophila TaxID=670291 RepID=A0A512BZR8_9HYPH|nr:hypothetical protein [Microvirga aerophila]GEO17451.1 hypothetical protein MAE02_51470 [Microvirga aerophila]